MMMENTSPTLTESVRSGELKEKVERLKTRLSERTQGTIDATSKTLENAVDYIKQHDTLEMVEDVQQIVKKHPGKSLLVGLLLGVMVGRALRRV